MMLRISNALIFFAVLFMTNMAFALTISNPSASIPRGTGNQIDLRFQMQAITLSDVQVIDANDFTTTTIQNLIIAQLDICIDPRSGVCRGLGNLKAEYEGQRDLDRTPEDDFDNLNVITFPEGGVSVARDPLATEQERHNAEIHVVITPLSNATTYDENTTIYLSYPTINQDLSVEVTLSSIVTSQPRGLAIRPGNQSLSVTWTPLEQADFATGPAGPTVGMRAYLVETDERNDYEFTDVLVGYAEDPNNENTRFSCILSIQDRATGACTFSCDNDRLAYLNKELVVANAPTGATVRVQEASRSASFTQFTGLTDTDILYAAFIQPLPDGARASDNRSCVMGSSVLTFSYAQITGGDQPNLTDPNCFIATAAYGSSLHRHLDELRWFRDQVLFQLPLGSSMVEFYYAVSPPLAEWIESRPLAAKLVRGVLFAPVHFIHWVRTSGQMMLSFLLIAFFCLAFSYRFLRKRSELSV